MSQEEAYLYEFGPFRMDPAQRTLERDCQPVPLQPKAFDILRVLVENCEKLVLKEDLMNRVWPETFVEESNLTQNIFMLRKALGDAAGERRYIVTVPGRGYRFAEKVRTIAVAPLPPPSLPPLRGLSWKVLLPVSTAVLLLTAAAGWYRLWPRGLTDKDTIILADFVNRTGDSVFDGTLRQGLSAQLEQSPFLNLLSDQRITQTLKLMAKPRDARLTGELAREVCQRTASAATVEGSITALGSQYVLGLEAVACKTGDVLAREQETASGKEQVLKALGKAASTLRRRLGESLPSVQKYDVPFENVTTGSLEALQAYTLGYRTLTVQNDSGAAVAFFQRAVALDPDFATAWARLGSCYRNVGENGRAAENTRKAYELRERTSEKERLYIAAHYHVFVTGNLEAAKRVYELWAQTYPRDWGPYNELGIVCTMLGEYEKGVQAAREAVALNSGSAQTRANLVAALFESNQLEEAKATARKAAVQNADAPGNHFNLYLIDFLQHDAAGMEREAAGLMSSAQFQSPILAAESDTAAYGGSWTRAKELTRQAVESAERADDKEAAAGYLATAAVRDALAGNSAAADQQARAAVALARGKTLDGRSAIALALAGDPSRASQLANELAAGHPEDTLVQYELVPMIRSAIALQAGDARKAVEALASAAPFETGDTPALLPAYLRGTAYLTAKDGAGAGREFQKVLDYYGVVEADLIGSLAHLGLARAYVLSGDTAKAKSAYQDFMELWNGADPDVPILKMAKAEYSTLKGR